MAKIVGLDKILHSGLRHKNLAISQILPEQNSESMHSLEKGSSASVLL